MLSAIVTTVVIFMLITWAYARLNSTKLFQGYVDSATISDPDELARVTKKANHDLLLQAIGVSITAGAIVFITPRLIASTQWLAIPFFGLAAAGFVNLFLWWRKDGSEGKEMIPFALLALMLSMIVGSPASVVASLLAKVPFLARLIAASNTLAFWAFIGFMVASALMFKAKQEDDPSRAKKHKTWGIILAVLIGLIFASCLYGALKGTTWSSSSVSTSMNGVKTEASENTKSWWAQFWAAITGSKDTDEPADEPADTPANEPEQPVTQPETYYNWHFRHFEVLQDDNDKNDDYFGTSILDAVILDKIAKGELTLRDTNGKDPEQLMSLITVDEYLAKLVDFAADDPALGAALMGAYDVENHTRHLGDFSSEMKEHPDAWMRLINGQKDSWVKDQPTYWKYLAAFVAAIEDSDDVYLKYYKAGLTDQMYMDAHTVDGTPDVIVMESATESGVVLVIENRIKGTATKAITLIRDDCGGQPCNIAEDMGITPAPNPNKTPSNNGGKPAGGNPPGGNSAGGNPPGGSSAGGNPNGDGKQAGGNPGEDPGWSPKDPDRGSQGLPVNDITGPDGDTNNGLGAQYSAVQDPTGSTFMDTYDEYKNYVKDNLTDPNNGGTRTGRDPNTATYTPPTYMPTDDNANTGNGGAPINNPTPVSPGATYTAPASGGTTTIDVTTEERGTDWGGLPDA